MISGINKIIENIILNIKKLKIGYNKGDKNVTINYTDNSTKFNYSTNIPLSNDKILQLSDEELGKYVKELTILNIKTVCKDKPTEMGKYLKMYNPAVLSIAGSTVTTQNIMPWLYGETKTEPLMPMPSGDFIKQIPNAINLSIPFDSVGISESTVVKIQDENKKHSEKEERLL